MTPKQSHALRVAEFVTRYQNARQAENDLWKARNDLIEKAYPVYGEVPENQRELKTKIELYAQAAESLNREARAAYDKANSPAVVAT